MTNYTLIILPEAREDILECALWYVNNPSQTIDLAEAFLDAIEQTLEKLKKYPEHNSIKHDDVRGILVHRKAPKGQPRNFPHIIFYRFQEPEIVVIQVFPVKSNPENIRRE